MATNIRIMCQKSSLHSLINHALGVGRYALRVTLYAFKDHDL